MANTRARRGPFTAAVAGRLLACLAVAVAAAGLFGTAAAAQDVKQRLDALVDAARKEGKVVILAPPDPNMRQVLPAAFKERYGVSIEYLGGRSSEAGARLRAERAAGVFSVDVALAGVQSMATIFHREKMLAPMKDELFFPDVVDGSKWKRGSMWFVDPEQTYVLRLFNTVGPSFYINTSGANASEFKSARDLLDTKWVGKITAHDPTVPGTGSNESARLTLRLGEDFVRKFYLGQKVQIYRDRRQITDGLARGRTPIAFGAEREEIERLRKDGFPVQAIYGLSDLPGSLSTGIGMIGLMDRAPHPNAAKLFINWLASQDGMKVFARERGEAPTRNDIGEEAFLAAEIIPKPGVEYFDVADWEFTVTRKEKIRQWVKEMIEGR